MHRLLLLGITVFILTACSGGENLQKLRDVKPTGTGFSQVLSAEYLKLAEYMEQNQDWMGSQYYADKGLRSAYGENVDIDPIAPQNDIGMDRYAELTQGFELFTEYGGERKRSTQPQLSARAQVLFDCWIGQVNRHANQNEIDYCQKEFYTALNYLNGAPEKQQGKTQGKTPVVSTSYLLFFDWDSTKLTSDAMSKVSQIIADIRQMGNVQVTINGHTDRSGSESYNLDLSQHRAQAVRDILVNGGIAQAIISLFAFGESDPAVPTADGVKEERNRRVEVFVE